MIYPVFLPIRSRPDPPFLNSPLCSRYLQNGCKDPAVELDNLGAIKSKIEEERRSKEDDEILFDEESDTSLLSYNEAVVHYHLKQYATATTILEVLFSNVEPIEEGLAIRISFLLLDCYHVLESPEKGSKPLEYLEKLLTRIDAELSKETAKKSSQKGEDTDVSSFFQAASEKSTLACPETITLSGLRVGLHLYKAKFHLMNRSFRSSKRDIKLALSIESNNPQATVLKANLEYLKANYRKALKLLQTACVEVQEEDALRMGEGVEGPGGERLCGALPTAGGARAAWAWGEPTSVQRVAAATRSSASNSAAARRSIVRAARDST